MSTEPTINQSDIKRFTLGLVLILVWLLVILFQQMLIIRTVLALRGTFTEALGSEIYLAGAILSSLAIFASFALVLFVKRPITIITIASTLWISTIVMDAAVTVVLRQFYLLPTGSVSFGISILEVVMAVVLTAYLFFSNAVARIFGLTPRYGNFSPVKWVRSLRGLPRKTELERDFE